MADARCPDPLKILVVTEDRVLQLQLSQFFRTVGYEALQAAESQSARAAVAAFNPKIILLDAELAAAADWELCRQLAQRPAGPNFRFLLVDGPDEAGLREALEAGIDDFLVKPLAYGELLSRLRAAARVLEYDRRLARQGRLDPSTGLLSASALAGHLRRQLGEHGGAAPVACALLDVDFFSRAGRLHGETAADSLVHALAQQLNQLRAGEVLGRLGSNRFAVLLAGASEAAALEWAEKARELLAAKTFPLGDATIKITVSGGVAASQPNERAESLLERAAEALAAAKASGRNCSVAWTDRQGDARNLEPDELFGRAVVRDVMTPCTLVVRADETVGDAIALVQRTRLDGLPVVDSHDKLLGVCLETDLADVAEADYGKRTVGDVLTTDVRTFAESDRLASLMEYFNGDSASLVVVVADGRPVGIVTCNSLLALPRPVAAGSLAADVEYTDTTGYLLVRDVRPLESAV